MGRKTLVGSLFLLSATILVFEFSSLDMYLQHFLYNSLSQHWTVDASDPLWRNIFYVYPKKLIFLFAAVIASFGVYWWKKKTHLEWRRGCVRVLLSLTTVVLLAIGGKEVTRVHCPNALKEFGGAAPYVKLLEKYPSDYNDKRGNCFPAGHASGGFALFSLYFLFRQKKYQRLGWAIGFVLGWAMGGYQMLKGAHFLSHTLVTMFLSLVLISAIHLALERSENHHQASTP